MDRTWPKIWMTCVTLTFVPLTWKWYMTHCSLLGYISATYEANPSKSCQTMEQTWPKIWTTHVTLIFDLLTWKRYMTHHPLMGWICATYKYNPWIRQQATKQTRNAWWTDTWMDRRTDRRMEWNQCTPTTTSLCRGIKKQEINQKIYSEHSHVLPLHSI